MKKIKNTRTIQIIVPNEVINDANSPYFVGGYTLITNSLNDDEQYLVELDNVVCSVAEVSNIHTEFVHLILTDAKTKEGYAINMLRGYKIPYVHIDKTLLDKPFSDTEILLKDYAISYVDDDEDKTKCYVEIGHYENGINRSNYTQFDELKLWAELYGIENVLIVDKITTPSESIN